jgi:hypothetical protein
VCDGNLALIGERPVKNGFEQVMVFGARDVVDSTTFGGSVYAVKGPRTVLNTARGQHLADRKRAKL